MAKNFKKYEKRNFTSKLRESTGSGVLKRGHFTIIDKKDLAAFILVEARLKQRVIVRLRHNK